MKKLIKNYTTEVPVEKTVAEIQALLVQNGARGVALEYNEEGQVKNIFFKVSVAGKELAFRLPAKPQLVYEARHGDALPHIEERYKEQWKAEALCIAWRICKTWLEAQLTLINLEQAKVEEIFLPYLIMPNNKTAFEELQGRGFLLPSGQPQEERR